MRLFLSFQSLKLISSVKRPPHYILWSWFFNNQIKFNQKCWFLNAQISISISEFQYLSDYKLRLIFPRPITLMLTFFFFLLTVKPGIRYRELGNIIQKHAQANGFSVVRSYCGHGIHRLFHTAPNVPHYASELSHYLPAYMF